MKLFKLKYFQIGNSLCGSDFENIDSVENINLEHIISFSELKKFTLPFSDNYVGDYALLRLSNNQQYFIKEPVFHELSEVLSEFNVNK